MGADYAALQQSDAEERFLFSFMCSLMPKEWIPIRFMINLDQCCICGVKTAYLTEQLVATDVKFQC